MVKRLSEVFPALFHRFTSVFADEYHEYVGLSPLFAGISHNQHVLFLDSA